MTILGEEGLTRSPLPIQVRTDSSVHISLHIPVDHSPNRLDELLFPVASMISVTLKKTARAVASCSVPVYRPSISLTSNLTFDGQVLELAVRPGMRPALGAEKVLRRSAHHHHVMAPS